MRFTNLVFGLLAIGLTSSLVLADEIFYEVSTTGSGSLNGVLFENQLITISAIGDIANVVTNGDVNLLLDGVEVSVEIAGIGSATFVDDLQVVSNNNSDLGGFGNTSTATGVVFVNDSIFANYDLRSELGPITATTLLNTASHATDQGALFFIGSTTQGTFEARFAAIPEPSSSGLILLMFGLSAASRRV